MEYDVFISYSTKDQEIADKVCKYLEDRGLRCFISSRDIPKGVEWPSAIAAALKSSRLFLAVFSNNYNLSMQVNKELTIASKRHIPLLTFKTTEDDFEGTKDYFLSEVNFITAYPDAEKALKPLYEDVSSLLKTTSSVAEDTPKKRLSFSYQEDRDLEVKELLSQKPKDSVKQLELANRLAIHSEWQTAFYWYNKAAEKDLKEAVFHLAECYQNGRGTKMDAKTSAELYERAYNLGMLAAGNRLGRLYYSGGTGLACDYAKSLAWYEKSDSEECPETYQDLADYYSEGKACQPDESKEFMYRKKYYDYHFYNALENENVESMFILGTLCEEGKGIDQNDYYAMSWFERAAKNGSNKAKYRLGIIYEYGKGVEKDREKAFKYVEEASAYYDEAMVKLGDYYRLGIGTEKNPEKAFQCYLLASVTNNVNAYYSVGRCYEEGFGTTKKPNKAEAYFQWASEQGLLKARSALGRVQRRYGNKKEGLVNLEFAANLNDYDALRELGVEYWKSEEEEELKKAIGYCERAAESNPDDNGDSLTRIGKIYDRLGPLHNEEKAFQYFQLAAKKGHKGAMRCLADCYVEGKGVEQDDFMAFQWGKKAVELGNDVALNTLGEFYRFGIGTKKNAEKAIECYKKRIDAGKCFSAVNIGEMYFYGEGVPVDYDEATKWILMACDGSFAQPYILIGRMYEMGVYGEKDISQAISWYNKGKQIGSPYADYYLGYCYAHDEILPNPAKAVEYYIEASNAGLSDAKLELAKCFQQGLGTETDKVKAFNLLLEVGNRWIEMRQAISSYVILARVKGGTVTNDRHNEMKKPLYAEAMFNLGKCYIDGCGTEVNISEGVKWITIAAKLGNEEALKYNISESFRRIDQHE